MEVRVSKGFVVLAQNTKDINYVQQAYALALSIKHSQSVVKDITLITNDKVPVKYRKAFDQIVPIPWTDDATPSKYVAEQRWKIYHASPYDETIVLDTDMLLLDDISSWWNYCSNFDIKFCSRIKNYKLETVVDTYHRKAFIANNLTSPYIALHYFKKTDTAHEFYKVLEFVINNWEWCWGVFTPKERQNWLSMDLAVAIAIEISGQQDRAIDLLSPLEFTHMKTPLQGWDISPVSWQDTVPHYFNNNGELVVGNIKQDKLFHYVEKNFITDKILTRLEELANGS
jgi:hypothetical protein